MLFELLDSRLIDILLIAAAVYFIFPGLFKRNKPNRNNTQSHSDRTIHIHSKEEDDKKGEYIDYEEIK